MRSRVRSITMILLLTILLAPGLLHARTAPAGHRAQASVSLPTLDLRVFNTFSSVWNLLTNMMKTGGQMDPAGSPPPSGSSTSSADTGGQLDPAGTPK